jgi:hypothetical protein
MYWHIDPQSLQTIHRSIMDDMRSSRSGWLRITVDIEA